ncbi:MAG TPA: hypothetical protein DDZ88_25885, partial [Verrucomicrobiales bacterium]|nr:hypothetical protein [Verrucomicrobiales bacterium]
GFNNTSRIEVREDRWRDGGKMTNSRMTNDERSPNAQNPKTGASSLEPRHSFVIPHSSFDIPGRRIELHSGNVFRFRPDGSRVEKYTSGQVNPFGLAWDRYGNLYSADCHSSPIYQLIRGAHYPSFGKPHDGLGFAPVMCQHTHGSTGICGIVYIDGSVWGPEWDDHIFVGNVVTSKVNHDHVTFTGSTPKANEQPDLLTSDDPWFRPVDLQLGPDNALYIADFYNKIIGHYEVPLEHPGRDKERGRIWRVVKTQHTKPLPESNLAALSDQELAQQLGSENLTRRRLASELVHLRGDTAYAAIDAIIPKIEEDMPRPDSMACRIVHGLWIGARLGKASSTQFKRSMEFDAFCAAHAFKVLNNFKDAPGVPGLFAQTRVQGDFNGGVFTITLESYELDRDTRRESRGSSERRKARVEAMGTSEDRAAIGEIVSLLSKGISDDMLLHTAKVALQRLLSVPENFKALPPDATHAAGIALAVPSAASSAWLWRMETSSPTPSIARAQILGHIARYGDADLLQSALSESRKAAQDKTITSQLRMVQSLSDGLSERGTPPPPELLAWAQELATQLLDTTAKQPTPAWTTLGDAKWSLQPRKLANDSTATVLQSLVKGGGEEESRTGTLQSQTFPAPAKLALWINGHRGFPNAKAHDKNLVRITDTETGRELARAFPPRNDTAKFTELDLAAHIGKPVRLEVIDGDDGKAYAWLGITGIEPAVISVNDFESTDTTRESLKTLAIMLQHSAPAALREKLAAYMPPRPAPPPLPVSPEQRKQLDTLIATRTAAFAKAKPDLETGANVFKMNCAACHQIKGEGGLIGPQLDGIGARGAERLCEDILDPNRNVDAHFHLHTLTMKDNSTFAGFLKAELGQIHLLADATGKEHRIAKKDIAKTSVTPISLMPPTFGQTLDESTFIDLLGYLLNEKAGK